MAQDVRVLVTAADVDAEILCAVDDCLDWFVDDHGLNTEEFIDRLCDVYSDGWDIEDYASPAARKILRYAREARRDA